MAHLFEGVMNQDELPKHPADVADELERLPVEEAQQEFRELPKKEGAAVLAEMARETWPDFLGTLEPSEILSLVRELPHNDAADVISSLEPETRGFVLGGLPPADRDSITRLLRYAPDTAGGIMSDQFIAIREDITIEQAQQHLRGRFDEAHTAVAYLYVVDALGKLVGIIRIHDLVFGYPERFIRDVMKREVQHVWADDDQEKIAQLFERYHFMAIPVLERDGRLVGLVEASQVLEVIRQETTEDMQLMVGLSGEERALTPWTQSLRSRLPWLCINLGTAFLAGWVVGIFEETIAAWSALAIFLPIIAGMGGNAANQALTIIIRDMALGNLSKDDGRKALAKEMMLGAVHGVVIGLIVALVGYYWKSDVTLGVVVGLAMWANMVVAGLSGVLIPYTLRMLKIDPALASSIMVTGVTDVAGFFFFLGLASLAR